MASPADLEIIRGAVFDVDFLLYDDKSATQPTDLANKRAILQFQERGTTYLRLDTATDSPGVISIQSSTGTISVHLNRSHTLRLRTDCNYYVVVVDLTDPNETEPPIGGRCAITDLPVEV